MVFLSEWLERSIPGNVRSVILFVERGAGYKLRNPFQQLLSWMVFLDIFKLVGHFFNSRYAFEEFWIGTWLCLFKMGRKRTFPLGEIEHSLQFFILKGYFANLLSLITRLSQLVIEIDHFRLQHWILRLFVKSS